MKTNLFSPNLSTPPNNRWKKKNLLLAHTEAFNLPPVESPSVCTWHSINLQLIQTQAASVTVKPSSDFSIFIRGSDVLVAQTRTEGGAPWYLDGLCTLWQVSFSKPNWEFPAPQQAFQTMHGASLSHHYGWCNSLRTCVVNQSFTWSVLKMKSLFCCWRCLNPGAFSSPVHRSLP